MVATQMHRNRTSRGGFSLAEVLLSTAVLGVGLTMAMAVFPAAVLENKSSTDDVYATIVLDNATMLCTQRLSSESTAPWDQSSHMTSSGNNPVLFPVTEYVSGDAGVDSPGPATNFPPGAYYPLGLSNPSTDAKASFRVLGMKTNANSSNPNPTTGPRMLVIVACRGQAPDFTWATSDGTSGSSSIVTRDDAGRLKLSGDIDDIQKGMPLINPENGDFVIVRKVTKGKMSWTSNGDTTLKDGTYVEIEPSSISKSSADKYYTIKTASGLTPVIGIRKITVGG